MFSKIKILILFVLVSVGAYAQDSLYFTTNVYNIGGQDTGGHLTINDTIYNQGSFPFVGTVTFAAKVVNFSADSSLSSQFTADSLTANDTLFPPPGANSYKAFTVTIINDTAPPFVIGPNTIVIWPIIKSNATLVSDNPYDTIYINTYYYPLGLKESPLANMYIFENPGQLNIHFGDAENLVKQVRIFNVLGQSMYGGTPDKSKNIPTAGWSMGIYLCEITTWNGDKRTFKFRLE